jgi:amino acid transporter
MAEQRMYSQEDTALKVGAIGKGEVTLVGVSAAAPVMCMSSFFGLASMTGRGVALAALIATVVIVLIGLSYGKLSEKYNRCGGTWAYMQQCMGQKAGLWTAFIYFAVLITTAGCPPALFAMYLNALVPAIPLWLGYTGCILLVVIITWFGVALSTKITVLVWLVSMALLLVPAFKVIGLSPEQFTVAASVGNAFTPSLGIAGLAVAAVTWVWAFVGFEYPAYMGEELKGGSKSVKFAVPMSGLLVGLIYVISCWIWTANISPDMYNAILADPAAQASGDFLGAYAAAVGYAAGPNLIALGIVVSAFACAMAFYSLMPRFLFDLSREGILPKGLTKVNKYQIPHVTTIIYAVVALAACTYACYYFRPDGLPGVYDWFTIMGISATTAYGFVCIGNIKDGWKDKGAWNGFVMRKLIPFITVAILLALLVYSFIGAPRFIPVFAVWYALAFIFAFAVKAKKA